MLNLIFRLSDTSAFPSCTLYGERVTNFRFNAYGLFRRYRRITDTHSLARSLNRRIIPTHLPYKCISPRPFEFPPNLRRYIRPIRQTFVKISDAERARTYENVIRNERDKEEAERKIDEERNREAGKRDEERR